MNYLNFSMTIGVMQPLIKIQEPFLRKLHAFHLYYMHLLFQGVQSYLITPA